MSEELICPACGMQFTSRHKARIYCYNGCGYHRLKKSSNDSIERANARWLAGTDGQPLAKNPFGIPRSRLAARRQKPTHVGGANHAL